MQIVTALIDFIKARKQGGNIQKEYTGVVSFKKVVLRSIADEAQLVSTVRSPSRRRSGHRATSMYCARNAPTLIYPSVQNNT